VCCALVAALLSIAAPRPATAAQVCPDIYAPVCAVTPDGFRRTYSNACFARLAHARILHNGRCMVPMCLLLPITKPVCAIDPATHRRKTYGSLCLAEQAKATFLRNGPCR